MGRSDPFYTGVICGVGGVPVHQFWTGEHRTPVLPKVFSVTDRQEFSFSVTDRRNFPTVGGPEFINVFAIAFKNIILVIF